MSKAFIKIYTATDNMEADLIRGTLEEKNIFCLAKGYQHRSMLGSLGQYIDLDILVPEHQSKEALSIIENFLKIYQQLDEWDDFIDGNQMDSKKSLRAALFYPFCFPGLGSYRIGNRKIGFVILILGLFCFGIMGLIALDLIFTDTFFVSPISSEAMGYCGIGLLFLICLDFILTVIYFMQNR